MEANTSFTTIELDSDSTISPINSTFEDDHETVTTPETEEDDTCKSVASNETDDDDGDNEDGRSVTDDEDEHSVTDEDDRHSVSDSEDGYSVTSDSSELPSEYIIHDHEALEECEYFKLRCSIESRSLKANNSE
jgi:hypothetical protein